MQKPSKIRGMRGKRYLIWLITNIGIIKYIRTDKIEGFTLKLNFIISNNPIKWIIIRANPIINCKYPYKPVSKRIYIPSIATDSLNPKVKKAFSIILKLAPIFEKSWLNEETGTYDIKQEINKIYEKIWFSLFSLKDLNISITPNKKNTGISPFLIFINKIDKNRNDRSIFLLFIP